MKWEGRWGLDGGGGWGVTLPRPPLFTSSLPLDVRWQPENHSCGIKHATLELRPEISTQISADSEKNQRISMKKKCIHPFIFFCRKSYRIIFKTSI